MKYNKLILTAALTIFAFSSIFAQNGPMAGKGQGKARMMKMNFLNLSDEQQTKIDKLRLEFRKEIIPLQTKIRSQNSEYRLMIVDENVTANELKKKLNGISGVRQEMALKRALHQRQVRSLLTDEQKVKFDQHIISERGGKAGHRGMHKRAGKRGPGRNFR